MCYHIFLNFQPVIMLRIIFRNTAALKINRNFSYGKSCGEMRQPSIQLISSFVVSDGKKDL